MGAGAAVRAHVDDTFLWMPGHARQFWTEISNSFFFFLKSDSVCLSCFFTLGIKASVPLHSLLFLFSFFLFSSLASIRSELMK